MPHFGKNIHEEIAGREGEILAALGIQPDPRGRHRRCPFPAHDDRNPSWRWDHLKARFYCSCSSGSAIDAAALMLGLDDRGAIRWVREILGGKAEPVTPRPKAAPVVEIDREARRRTLRAQAIWQQSESIVATPAERYLRRRCIDPSELGNDPVGWPETVRWSADASTDPDGQKRPAMLTAINHRDTGLVVAVQRLFFSTNGEPLTIVEKGKRKKLRKTLGNYAGHAAQLSADLRPAIEHGCWGLAEGTETALSAQQLLQMPVWAAIGANNMSGVRPPKWARHATVISDHDGAGRDWAEKAARRLISDGMPVDVIRAARPGADANDVLRRGAR